MPGTGAKTKTEKLTRAQQLAQTDVRQQISRLATEWGKAEAKAASYFIEFARLLNDDLTIPAMEVQKALMEHRKLSELTALNEASKIWRTAHIDIVFEHLVGAEGKKKQSINWAKEAVTYFEKQEDGSFELKEGIKYDRKTGTFTLPEGYSKNGKKDKEQKPLSIKQIVKKTTNFALICIGKHEIEEWPKFRDEIAKPAWTEAQQQWAEQPAEDEEETSEEPPESEDEDETV